MYKKHLLGGVAKGAFSESDAEAKFNKWLEEKNAKTAAKASKLAGDARAVDKARAAAESKAKEEKAKVVAAKKAAAAGIVAEDECAETESPALALGEVADEITESDETIDVAVAVEVAAEAIQVAEAAATPEQAVAAIEVAEAAVEAVEIAEEKAAEPSI